VIFRHATPWSAAMNVPHYINENKSNMRGIKSGWYAVDENGSLSAGPFVSHEECLRRSNQPDESRSSEHFPPPK
jgi:hypothetical protein